MLSLKQNYFLPNFLLFSLLTSVVLFFMFVVGFLFVLLHFCHPSLVLNMRISSKQCWGNEWAECVLLYPLHLE